MTQNHSLSGYQGQQPTAPDSPFIAGASGDFWGVSGGNKVYRCNQSGALFYDRDEIQPEGYQDYYPYLKSWDPARLSAELHWRRAKYRFQLQRLKHFGIASPGKLLDLGAGPGYLCKVAMETGWDATGVEISEIAKDTGVRAFGVRYAELEDLTTESFDVICAHHVLEHLPNPRGFMDRVGSLLRPEGLLVVHVPHVEPLTYAIRNFFRPKRKEKITDLYGNIHISGFTPGSLESFICRYGFITADLHTVGMWSRFYDPFFLANYLHLSAMPSLVKKTLRHTIEWAGVPFSRGHWIVGIFRKARD